MAETDRYREIPSVDCVLQTAQAAEAVRRFDRALVVEAIRFVLDGVRRGIANGAEAVPSAERIMAAAHGRLKLAEQLPLRRVVNATGVVLHTNLGRALLAEPALAAVQLAAAAPINLELDLAEGARGERDQLVEADLCALTGAAAATVVNNNAAALLLALNAIAEGREVIVSRGELIEIGGSFRLPELMAKSGARLREVGTTNRTRARDYLDAISERTALILKVHTSNYRVVGFTEEVALAELSTLARERGIPVLEDLGSGALIDLSVYGLPKEPIARERIAAGADLVTFSGDKLLGGPQAGLIVGRAELIAELRRNPLKRALRCDKLTLAALAATLRLYRTAPDIRAVLPTLHWLTRDLDEMASVGARAVELLRATLGEGYSVEVADSPCEIGSGAQPTKTLASKAVVIHHPGIGAHDIARRFRRADPAIIGRVHDGRLWLDLRGIWNAADLVPGGARAGR